MNHAPDPTREDLVRFLRHQCRRSDAVLVETPLAATPRGRHGDREIASVRWVVLHMIEETAAHSGHLEIARELLDRRARLGLR
jgi:Protein of unknown function (DUF664)